MRRRCKPHQLKETNEVAGFYSAIIGTLYVVILAFMLARVWDNFAEAEVNVAREANTLVNLYCLAQSTSPADGVRIQALARSYAVVTLQTEWPARWHGRR